MIGPTDTERRAAAAAAEKDMTDSEKVILSILKLGRAMRRCPPERGEFRFPPAVGRLLASVHEHRGISGRELCELLDLRPSSLSEMLVRGEAEGLLTRTPDPEDRRVQHIALTEKGENIFDEMARLREEGAEKKTACFTEEEKAEFCRLCDKLSSHLEESAAGRPAPEDGFPPRCPRREPRKGPGPRPPFPDGTRIRC